MSGRRRLLRRAVLAGGVVALATAAGVAYFTVGGPGTPESARQAEVKAIGATGMPFDLDRTTHVFTDLPDGGVQRVTANDATDSVQVRLVRQHLLDEVARFTRGDFGDPKTIHGEDMPGVAALEAGTGRLDVRYEQLDDGAQIRFRTADSTLVTAVHDWFRAQSSDHRSPHDKHTR